MARRDKGAHCGYVTEEQRRQPGCLGREIDRLSHSRALRGDSTQHRGPGVQSATLRLVDGVLVRAGKSAVGAAPCLRVRDTAMRLAYLRAPRSGVRLLADSAAALVGEWLVEFIEQTRWSGQIPMKSIFWSNTPSWRRIA